jgi:hypothetical protein
VFTKTHLITIIINWKHFLYTIMNWTFNITLFNFNQVQFSIRCNEMTSINNQQWLSIHVYAVDNWVHTLSLSLEEMVVGSSVHNLIVYIMKFLLKGRRFGPKWNYTKVHYFWCKWCECFLEHYMVLYCIFKQVPLLFEGCIVFFTEWI